MTQATFQIDQKPSHGLQDHLQRLTAKYGVKLPGHWRLTDRAPEPATGELLLTSGDAAMETECSSESLIPLLPWRHCRRFQEMRSLLHNGTVRDPLSYRFRHFAPRQTATLAGLLYREIDLLQWLSGQRVESVFATFSGKLAGNVVLGLANGAVCGMELSVALPATAAAIDRHEVIARRGVVCDQVVDSISRPPSVRLIHNETSQDFTDVDFELFGLNEQEAALVRAAFAVAVEPSLQHKMLARHQALTRIIGTVFTSAAQGRRLDVAKDIA